MGTVRLDGASGATLQVSSSNNVHYIAHPSLGTVYDLPAAGACHGCEYNVCVKNNVPIARLLIAFLVL